MYTLRLALVSCNILLFEPLTLVSLLKRDIDINRYIKLKEIREQASLYYQLPNLLYYSAWRARERVCDQINCKGIPPQLDSASLSISSCRILPIA
jgi:hypothetical protein